MSGNSNLSKEGALLRGKATPGPWRYVGFETSMGAHVVIGHPIRDDVVCTVAGSPQSCES